MSITLFGIVVLVTVVACIRPQVFRRIFQEFSERKYILAGAAFTALLSGTIFVVTQPMEQQTYVSENTKQTITAVDPLESPETSEEPTIEVKDVSAVDALAFPKQETTDPNLAAGQRRLVQAGSNGQTETIYTVTYDKGVEVSRAIKSKSVTIQPTPEIIAIGSAKASEPTKSQGQAAPQSQQQQAKSNDSRLAEKLCKNSHSWACTYLLER